MLFKDKEFFDIVKKKEKMPTWWNGRHEGLQHNMSAQARNPYVEAG